MSVESLYSLTARSLEGQPIDLARYRGKVTLVVNVASECGYTPQYAGLEALHRELSRRGFAILGFPSNDFGAQEPGTAADIATFCEKNYGVTFPMFEKITTRPGPAQSPVYELIGRSAELPSWNFAKYLISKDGQVVRGFASKVSPDAPELRDAILAALAAPASA